MNISIYKSSSCLLPFVCAVLSMFGLLQVQMSYSAPHDPHIIEDNKETPANQITDLTSIWAQLDERSEIWIQMIDIEPKRYTIEKYIELFKEQGIVIRKSALDYVDIVDDFLKKDASAKTAPFPAVLRAVAILEYDFDNGIDPDVLIKAVFGEEVYKENLKRFNR